LGIPVSSRICLIPVLLNPFRWIMVAPVCMILSLVPISALTSSMRKLSLQGFEMRD